MKQALWVAALVAGINLGGCGGSSPPVVDAATARDGWIGAWGAAPYGPYPLGPLSEFTAADVALPLPSLLPNDHASEQTFRMIVHPTIGGATVRVRLSNLMGDRPVTFSPVRIARSLLVTGPALVPGSDTPVLFGGAPAVTVAPGAEAVSDPVGFGYDLGQDLAVSFHVNGETGPITWHAIAFSLNYLGLPMSGDSTGDVTGLGTPQPTIGWFFLSGVDVLRADSPGTIVAIGDSITDGAYIVPESNTRWTDDFARRLSGAGIAMGVLNEGINSNTVTAAGTPQGKEYQGPPAVQRFARDVLGRPGVRSVVILEGTNDLSAGIKAEDVHAGILSMVERAHQAGLCVVVGTIMPRSNTPIAAWSAANEVERRKLNTLLRADSGFDGLAEFAQTMASPLDPESPNPAYYFADQLHPNSLGTQVMADAVPMQALVPPPAGHCARRLQSDR